MIIDRDGALYGRVAGLPDEAFETDGLLTKRVVRASALAHLRPRPGELLWDVGTGAGSIAIEWCRAAEGARAIGIERRADRASVALANAARLTPEETFRLVEGPADEVLAQLPTPSASRSTCRATASPILRIPASSRSAAGTRPRCREGASISRLRGRDPSTGIPMPSTAERTSASCLGLPTWLRITPAIRTAGSNVAMPSASAPTLRDACRASTTSTTGASMRVATCAVEATPGVPSRPSNKPIAPSTTARSAPSAPWSSNGAMRSSPQRKGSRLRPGRPLASPW